MKITRAYLFKGKSTVLQEDAWILKKEDRGCRRIPTKKGNLLNAGEQILSMNSRDAKTRTTIELGLESSKWHLSGGF